MTGAPMDDSPTPMPLKSPLSPASAPPHSPPASSSRSNNLPQPPPAHRVPPPKHRSTHPSAFKIRNKNKSKKGGRKDSLQAGEDEDDWFQLVDGNPPLSSGAQSIAPGPSSRRESGDIQRKSTSPVPLFDSQMTEVPPREPEKKSGRGRGLVKKTSQLFSRSSKDKDHGTHSLSPENGSTLNLPGASRQNSHSSAASGDSASTSTSSRRAFSIRPGSSSSKTQSPRSSMSRRLSQDSASSWQAPPPRPVRSGSSSIYDSPADIHLPIPQRQASHLSASVPSLSRQSLPQPANGSLDSSTGPSRMSAWFSHLLPSSSTPQSSSIESNSTSSPQKKTASVAASFLNAARQKAVDGVRHLLDSEAQPDKCPDTIWVMGFPHPGYRPSTPLESASELPKEPEDQHTRRGSISSDKSSGTAQVEQGTLRPSTWKRKEQGQPGPVSSPSKGFGNLFSSSTLSLALPGTASVGSPVKGDKQTSVESPSKAKKQKAEKEIIKWPEQFYDDFRSRVWCTYRSQYAPIIALPANLLLPTPESYYSAFGPPADLMPPQSSPPASTNPLPQSRMSTSPWSWSRADGGLTSDAGWGCMLRTGQSMLANALLHLHLGRDWRLPPAKPSTSPLTTTEKAELEAYSTYVKILSWFLDDPSPLCPFSVHRMALIGKELGKEVGEWFGPSTAAGALKTLGNNFPLCGLTVATAADSIVYRSDVYAASRLSSDGWTDEGVKSTSPTGTKQSWGSKAVLILIGIRLGLDGVNPIYHDSIKTLFTFPQSVGIAGGRPSSSYYFVASQGNSLFYLDPHFTRPAVPLEIPPAAAPKVKAEQDDDEEAVVVDKSAGVSYTLDVVNVDDVSDDTDSDSFAPAAKRRDSIRASPRGKRLSASAAGRSLREASGSSRPDAPDASASDPFTVSEADAEPVGATASTEQAHSLSVDAQTMWYANAYPEAALRTFHCEKVKKMPLTGLDPSMLLGFLVTDQEDFDNFCERVKSLPQKIFTVQAEPPSWDEDDEAGLESVSEPDMDELADEMAGTDLDNGDVDVSGTTILPMDIPGKKSNGNDEEWEEELRSTPGQSGGGYATWKGPAATRPGPAPLRGEQGGMDTESWVRPLKEGEAPNGQSVL